MQMFLATYGEKLKATGNAAGYQLLNQPIQIEGAFLTISLLNRVQETLFQNIKEDLIAALRETFNRSDIQVQTTFVQQAQTRKPYTDQEKLLFLSKKNSAIALLQERLLLEVAY